MACDAFKALKKLSRENSRFDIVFLDPPYYRDLAKKTLKMISGCDILAPIGLVVIQHYKKDFLPEEAGGLVLFKRSGYGDTVVSFYKRLR